MFGAFDLPFIAFSLLTVLGFFAFATSFVYFYERGCSKFRVILRSLFYSNSDDFVYRIISWGFLIFTFIAIAILTNNIKTSKVL